MYSRCDRRERGSVVKEEIGRHTRTIGVGAESTPSTATILGTVVNEKR